MIHAEQVTVDGVPVFFVPKSEGSTTVTLSFGVGFQDEAYGTIGITHLIEHLAMSTLPPLHLEHNAVVVDDETRFYATGTPDAVADVIARICDALSALPVERIEHERQVLLAEAATNGLATAPSIWASRFGLRGLGLSYLDEHQRNHQPDAVLAHAQTFFTRANAAVVVVGQMPEKLRLPLPDGEPVVRTAVPVRPQNAPAGGHYRA